MTPHPTRDRALIFGAGSLRSFGVGLMGVVLGIYLFRAGLSSFAIGSIIAVGLGGAALATVLASLIADRLGRRSFLIILSLLSSVAGIGLAISVSLPVLAILAFVGMLNGTGTDRSAALDCHRTILVSRHLHSPNLAVQHIHADGRLESHDDALRRLVHTLNLPEHDMFRSAENIVADAYRLQGNRISYARDYESDALTVRRAAG